MSRDYIWRLLEGKAGCAVTGEQDVAAPTIFPMYFKAYQGYHGAGISL
ncbi:MAG TPA: hypothetical protein PLJ00_02425 [Chitinophagales bacterium]|nr:hypothetical protein [Chitinophagales bacterium]HRG26719.1 hypothetical protein [Chitinophagales bacterium]HRG84896.1 hypothetical protein [Chitinophagales bacterium]HRH53452.1 hypothetical protein [Chitinophagales bacterium]